MSIFNHTPFNNVANFNRSSNLASKSGVILNTFPVDLDLLFWADNLSVRNEKLDLLGNNTWGWMLTPWGAHFVSSHIEGAKKWYLNSPDRPLAVRAPHDGTFYQWNNWDYGIVYANSTELVKDIALYIQIGEGCFVQIDHLCMLKTIYDHLQAHNSYSFTEGELIGYTSPDNLTGHPAPQIDFWFFDNYEPVCPYSYLNSTLQAKVTAYFDLQYQRAKLAGVYPESNLCNPLLIHIENSPWGAWLYEDGPYNAYITDFDSIKQYQMGRLTFLAPTFWNNETFHKDPRDYTLPRPDLPGDVIGVVTDDVLSTNLSGYKSFGFSLVKQVSGTPTNGILEIIPCYGGWGWAFNESVYTRYSINTGGAGEEDDQLTIEYFENLLDAQSGFTNMSLTYQRYYPIDQFGSGGFPWYYVILGILSLIGVIAAVFILRRRKHD